MALLIRFVSDEWRGYTANMSPDAEAWRAQNPQTVEVGPFDAVTVDRSRGRVTGTLAGAVRELARANRDEPWRIEGLARLYDHVEVVAKTLALVNIVALVAG